MGGIVHFWARRPALRERFGQLTIGGLPIAVREKGRQRLESKWGGKALILHSFSAHDLSPFTKSHHLQVLFELPSTLQKCLDRKAYGEAVEAYCRPAAVDSVRM